MSKQRQMDAQGHAARNGGTEIEAQAGGVSRVSPSSHPHLCARGWQALGTCMALVCLGVLWHGHWQATEAGHPRYRRYSETSRQMACFQQCHSTHCFAKVFTPKYFGKEFCSWGRRKLGPRPVMPEAARGLQLGAGAVTFWMGMWMWGHPGLLLRPEASDKLSVHGARIRELKKEATPEV